jgi:protocatechuate 3,4-dioxygenase beta subunit
VAATGATVLIVNVVDGAGVPVPGATVITRPSSHDAFLGERVARADADGTARFAGLAPGVWSVRELRGGALDAVEVAAQGETHAVVALPEGLRVEGLVVDSKNQPVADASVWLPSGEREVQAWHVVTTTRGDGTFSLEHIAPKSIIDAVAPGFGRAPVVWLAPKDSDESDPTVRRVRIQFRSKGRSLAGQVLDADGKGCEGAIVLVGDDAYAYEYSGQGDFFTNLCVRTGADGRFHVDGLSDQLRTITLWSRATGHATTRMEVNLSALGEQVSVRLQRGAQVRGTIRDTDGRPIEGAAVHAFQDALEPPELVQFVGPGWARRSTLSAVDGTFELRDVHPGQIRLRATLMPVRGADGAVPPLTDAARVCELAPGTELRWDAVLGEEHSITGLIVDAEGTALTDWTVVARLPRANQQSLMAASDVAVRRQTCSTMIQAAAQIAISSVGNSSSSPISTSSTPMPSWLGMKRVKPCRAALTRLSLASARGVSATQPMPTPVAIRRVAMRTLSGSGERARKVAAATKTAGNHSAASTEARALSSASMAAASVAGVRAVLLSARSRRSALCSASSESVLLLANTSSRSSTSLARSSRVDSGSRQRESECSSSSFCLSRK